MSRNHYKSSKMRAMLLLILTTLGFNGNAQTKLLNKYPFEKGGYAIIGLLSESDPNDLQKQLGEFYTDDIQVLNEFKKVWVFATKSPMYACGYHYSIQVTHYGTFLESFEVNLNCNVIATDRGYFYFDAQQLAQFKDRLKKPTQKHHSFNSISEGKNFISTVKKDKALLLTFEPIWTNFEGKFRFTYKNPDKKDDCDQVERRLKKHIKKLNPNEDFILHRISWSSRAEYEFELICKKSLYDNFTIYPKHKNWEAYKPTLVTYWK